MSPLAEVSSALCYVQNNKTTLPENFFYSDMKYKALVRWRWGQLFSPISPLYLSRC
jgi:hypothetical protein